MQLFGAEYKPYRTLYEQYLEYPAVFWPPKLGAPRYQIIPNGVVPLAEYPVDPDTYYVSWLNASNSRDRPVEDRAQRHSLTQLEFQFLSEARLYQLAARRKMSPLQFFVVPELAESLFATKLTFSGKHLSDALNRTGPFILNLPKGVVSYPDGRYLTSVLVDFQSTSLLGIKHDPEKYFLVLHYWWAPLPKDRHPGELKTDTSIIMMRPDESLEEIFQNFEQHLRRQIAPGIASGLVRSEGSVDDEMALAKKLYALIVGSTIIITSENELVTPAVEIAGRKISPKILYPSEDGSKIIPYPGNARCPCGEQEPFRRHCRRRLSESETFSPRTSYFIGEMFHQKMQEGSTVGVTVPPHLQVYWHKKRQDGTVAEEAFPVIHAKDIYHYQRGAEALARRQEEQARFEQMRKRRWIHRRIAGKMQWEQAPELQPVSYPEPDKLVTEPKIRDTEIVRWLKQLYNDTCQMCGYRVVKPDGSGYSIGAHIMPFAEFPHLDVPENILILCPLHHDEFDLGTIRIDTDLFYWLREQRLLEQQAHPEDRTYKVPVEYEEGFVIKHLLTDTTAYSAMIHNKHLDIALNPVDEILKGHR